MILATLSLVASFVIVGLLTLAVFEWREIRDQIEDARHRALRRRRRRANMRELARYVERQKQEQRRCYTR